MLSSLAAWLTSASKESITVSLALTSGNVIESSARRSLMRSSKGSGSRRTSTQLCPISTRSATRWRKRSAQGWRPSPMKRFVVRPSGGSWYISFVEERYELPPEGPDYELYNGSGSRSDNMTTPEQQVLARVDELADEMVE